MKTYAPAFKNDDAFFCRFFIEIGSYLDKANRRLHEVDFRTEEGEGAFSKCPFQDSRKGYLINKSALKQIMSEWDNVLDGIHFFSSLFSIDNEEEINLARAWRISMTSMFSPLYLFKKNNGIKNGELDTSISGVFKIMLDVPTTIDLMIIKGAKNKASKSFGKLISNHIQQFADETTILLNGDYACAGSPALINNVTDILFKHPNNIINTNDIYINNFSNLIEFKNFSYLMSSQYIINIMYLLVTMYSMEIIYKYHNIDYTDNQNILSLSAYERRRLIALQEIMDITNHSSIFIELFELINSPNLWGANINIINIVELCKNISLKFISMVTENNFSVEQFIIHYTNYQQDIYNQILLSQNIIEKSINIDNMFDKNNNILENFSKHLINGLKK